MQLRSLIGTLLLLQASSVLSAGKHHLRGGKFMLLSFGAHSGEDIGAAFNTAGNNHGQSRKRRLPDAFHVGVLHDAADAALAAESYIVTEMLKENKVVALAAFTIPKGVNATNWWTEENLAITYPLGISSADFTVDYQKPRKMALIASRNSLGSEDCDTMSGLMGSSWSTSEPCDWVTKSGRIPVFFYATENGAFKDTVDYADDMQIYIIAKDKLHKKIRHLRQKTRPQAEA